MAADIDPGGPWIHLPEAPRLLSHDLHIWRICLDVPGPQVEAFFRLLSEDERLRADRYAFPGLRRRFVVGRGYLRQVLGLYLRCYPESLGFSYGETGKPSLPEEGAEETFQFNVSHTGEVALIAVTRRRRVGIDVEYIRPDLDDAELASVGKICFSLGEMGTLRAAPEGDVRAVFYALWTSKEAYVKAIGAGLSAPLLMLDLSPVFLYPGRWVTALPDVRQPLPWSFLRFSPAPGYTAAVAVEGDPVRLSWWQVTGGETKKTKVAR